MTVRTPLRGRSTTSAVTTRRIRDWQDDSACKTDPELFFPTGTGAAAEKQTVEAKKVCGGCLVREQCLQWALDEGEDFGVLGGLTHKERRRLLRGEVPSPVSQARKVLLVDPNPDAADAYLAGEASNVSDVDRLAAIVSGIEQGMTYRDFDELHGLTPEATSKWVSRMRCSYRDRGLVFPTMRRREPVRIFTKEQALGIRKRAATGEVSEADLSREYRVSRRTISRLLLGDSYRDVGGPLRRPATSSPAAVGRTIGQQDMGAAA